MFNKVQTSCFANTQRCIIATSTRQTFTLAFQRVNFHLNFHKASTPPLSRGAKKRKLISQLPLENRLIFKGFILLEVALQQTLEGAAVTGLVAGHRCSPHWQAASRPMGSLGISRLCGIYLFIFSLSFKSQGCGSLPKNFHRRALLWLMKRVFTS